MDIQLEQIELVKDRTGVSYKEAKEALEFAEGNVVDAIIYIEENINHEYEKNDVKAVNNIISGIKDMVKKGNIAKVRVYKGDDLILNVPVTVGTVAVLLFPWGVLASAVASAATKCRVELVKADGTIVDVNEKAGSAVESIKNKGGVVVDELKDKGNDLYKSAVEKGGDFYETVKAKGSDFYQGAVEKGTDFYNEVKAKSMDFYEEAKSKGGEFYENTKAQVTDYLNKRKNEEEFDFSDLDIEKDGQTADDSSTSDSDSSDL